MARLLPDEILDTLGTSQLADLVTGARTPESFLPNPLQGPRDPSLPPEPPKLLTEAEESPERRSNRDRKLRIAGGLAAAADAFNQARGLRTANREVVGRERVRQEDMDRQKRQQSIQADNQAKLAKFQQETQLAQETRQEETAIRGEERRVGLQEKFARFQAGLEEQVAQNDSLRRVSAQSAIDALRLAPQVGYQLPEGFNAQAFLEDPNVHRQVLNGISAAARSSAKERNSALSKGDVDDLRGFQMELNLARRGLVRGGAAVDPQSGQTLNQPSMDQQAFMAVAASRQGNPEASRQEFVESMVDMYEQENARLLAGLETIDPARVALLEQVRQDAMDSWERGSSAFQERAEQVRAQEQEQIEFEKRQAPLQERIRERQTLGKL